jgi:Fic family protein
MFNTLSITISWEVLNLISEIDEFKGAWRALGQLGPDHLSNLKRAATIESIGSFTRIKGSSLSDLEVEKLLGNPATQKFRSQEEEDIAGYAAVMNRIFENHEDISLTESNIRQLHRDLLQFSNKDSWYRGNYKKSVNHIEAFETAMPVDTPLRMEELINWTTDAMERKELHSLLIVSVFIVVFLAIHPFQDGNGRLSHVLTTLLLLRMGYAYVSYSSLEAVIEQSGDAYYQAIRTTLKKDAPDWMPWIVFFLRALQQQKVLLQTKVEQEKLLFTQFPELSLQIIEHVKSSGRISIGGIVTLTNANRNTIKKHLESLVAAKHLQQNGSGRGSWYSL